MRPSYLCLPTGSMTFFLLLSLGVLLWYPWSALALDCYRTPAYRGIGRPIHACPEGMEEDGLLCYPHCKEHYTGIGPVCWEGCAAGYSDIGAACIPNTLWGDSSNCPWYDICGITLDEGCVLCPAGYEGNGCICSTPGDMYFKHSYGRGVGEPLGCASHEEEQFALCYPLCSEGSSGMGPLCWSDCYGGMKPCGPFCLEENSYCLPKMRAIENGMSSLSWDILDCIDIKESGNCDYHTIVSDIIRMSHLMYLPLCGGRPADHNHTMPATGHSSKPEHEAPSKVNEGIKERLTVAGVMKQLLDKVASDVSIQRMIQGKAAQLPSNPTMQEDKKTLLSRFKLAQQLKAQKRQKQ